MTPKITVHGGASHAALPESELRESPGTGVPMEAVEGDEVTGDGSDEEYAPDAVPLPESDPGQDYEALTVEELKELLADRNLPKSGKRDELVQRLRDDDAATAETE